MDDFDYDDMLRNAFLWFLMLLVTLVVFFITMTGCSPRVVPVERISHDTLYVAKEKRDSVYLRDSVFLHEYVKGDTVYVDRVRWKEYYTEKLRTDTVYKSVVDTCTVKVTEYKQTQWQKTTSWFGKFFLVVAALLLLYGVVKCRKQVFRF